MTLGAEARAASGDGKPRQAAFLQEQALIGELMDGRAAVQNEFMPLPRVRGLIECAHRRRDRGEFHAARIGAARGSMRREAIRGDLTCWLDDPLFPEERRLLDDLERMRLSLNRNAYLGLFDLEIHYAWYPPGAAYARHVDQLRGRDQRVLTVILYLNDGWQPGLGGELRIFGTHGHRDIEPVGGRLVRFLSDRLEHAVLPARTDRWSITGWFRRQGAV